MDLTKALAPKSDQLDFADLDGQPPQVFTITEVSENGTELADQQPVNIRLAEFPRVWRPAKGMLRVLADNWGLKVDAWIGRKVELYGDPNVYFGKERRGGTRISRLSHISSKKTTLVNPRGGRNAYWTVEPLPDAEPQREWHAEVAAAQTPNELKALWRAAGEAGALTDELKASVTARVKELQATDVPTEEPPTDDAADAAWKDGQ